MNDVSMRGIPTIHSSRVDGPRARHASSSTSTPL